jgi:D-cysteine desulfhydrase family pyridoxal phosphate-dependent enzyme
MPDADDRATLDRRIPLAHLPTPLMPLERLGAHLGFRPGQLLAKLDDATGLAGGGNKVRKLEYLCADARTKGCDTLVTGGGAQSNHARLTAAAARRLGFDCTLVLGGPAPDPAVGNVVLDRLFDVEIVWLDAYTYQAVENNIAAACDRLRAAGRQPYHLPIGGSTPLGALGYVRCAHEIRAAVADLELVVIASGSGGTHAGLAAGLGNHRCVYGVDVGARPDLGTAVQTLAADTARLAGLPEPIGTAKLDSTQIGTGYAAPTAACREAIHLAARLEGLVLDPVYTGKALAGLIAARRSGLLAPTGSIVFVHTGGLPSIFTPAHAAWLTQP